MSSVPPGVIVVVRIPYNRPENAVDPPIVEWSPEKEAYLWDAITRSRGAGSAGTDWNNLAAILQVPLPYLMYKAQVRYEEDLRGLQGMSTPVLPTRPAPEARSNDTPSTGLTPTSPPRDMSLTARGLSTPLSRQGTPLATSKYGFPPQMRSPPTLLSHSTIRTGSGISSTVVLGRTSGTTPRPSVSPSTIRRPLTPPSPPSTSSSEEGEEHAPEDQEPEVIARRLRALEQMVTSQGLGFARRGLPTRGPGPMAFSITPTSHIRKPSSESTSANSSIPSIPSPPSETTGTQISNTVRDGNGVINARSNAHNPPIQPLRRPPHPRGAGSNHESSASSFSDISDASLSSSALNDALNSNLRSAANSTRQ